MKKFTIKGLKKAVGDYQRNIDRLHCIIYFDTDDGMIWTNVYSDSNSWSDYHSKTIHALNTYFYQACREEHQSDFTINMQTVRKTAMFVYNEYRETES